MARFWLILLVVASLLPFAIPTHAETDWSQYATLDDEQTPDSLIAAPNRDPNQPSPYQGPPGYNPDRPPTPKAKPKRKWWEFWKLFMPQADPEPTPTEEQLLEVGPREFDASPEPLLRWPKRWRTGQGLLSPGLYLLESNINPNKETYHPELTIKRGSTALWTVPLKQLRGGNEPQSPVTTIETKKDEKSKPPHRSIRLEWSPDGQALRFHYQVGAAYYQSPWLYEAARPAPQF